MYFSSRAGPSGSITIKTQKRREDAIHISVVIGDELFSESCNDRYNTCSGGSCSRCLSFHNLDEIADTINAIHAKVIAVGPTASSAHYTDIDLATGPSSSGVAGALAIRFGNHAHATRLVS